MSTDCTRAVHPNNGLCSNVEGGAEPSLTSIFADVRSELVGFLTRRTGSGAVAADLSHDLFERLGAVRVDFPDQRRARSYLFRMARNIAIDHGRLENRRAEILSGAEILFEDVVLSPETIAIDRDRLRLFEQVLGELPENVRQSLLLSRLNGLSHGEIARQLGISVSSVEKYKVRALNHCRQRLGDDF